MAKTKGPGFFLALCAITVLCTQCQKKTEPPPAPSAPAAAPALPPSGAPGAPSVALKGVCPDKIVIQTDWFATPERAAAYQLVGPNGAIDKKHGTYSGPLGTTGVNVEVRLGGPFIGFQPIPALMYQNPEIYLGYVATDDAVQAVAKFPTKAVVAPLDINPQVLIWDPASFTVSGWPDVARTKAKIIYIEGLPFMDYLISKGFVTKAQLDASFDGTPSRFVAEGGKIIQQGYASNEPYRWEHDVPGWKKPVKFLLVHDSGYQIYPQGLAVRAAQLASSSACLKLLVPIIQRAQVAYMSEPGPTNDALVKIATELAGGPPITASANAAAVKSMKELGLVGNGPDQTLGNFDLARVDRTIALLKPIFAARGVKVPANLAAADIVTNEFIDTTIHQ
jgi:hypothetical protein